SYVVLDNDFQGLYSSGLDGLRVTCAHEFFHMIQVGYQFRDSDIFFMEASATWVEDLVCDDVNDYLQYLDSIFNYDNTTFTSRTNLHEYGMSLWFHFLSDKYSTDIVKDIWEQVVTYPALHACHMALIPFATTLSDEIAEFYAWNLKTGSHADTLKYYSEGNLYPEQAISGSDTLTEVSTFRKTVQKTAARYLNIAADDQTTIIFAMVNANWESAQNQSDALLQVCLHDAEPYYYQITDSVFASLISDQGYGWRFVSCVRSSEIDGRPEIYPEFNASFFGSISGTAWIYQNQNEEGSVKVGTLPGVAISCLGAGEDHLFHTVDDKTYAYQLTNASGAFQFFGLVPGEYLITMDPENLPEPFVPNDTLFVVETYVDEGQDVEDIDFSFREIRETALPVCIPNPYCINNGPEMKIPFVLDTPDVIKFAVFSSQGFQIYYQETYFNTTDVIFLRWDGRVNGQPVPTGIYIYTIVCGNKVLRQEKIAIIQ
ncbi:hypothetical protein JW835_03270, partial [bacterium]|nr:hypothetical protein [bacterium]